MTTQGLIPGLIIAQPLCTQVENWSDLQVLVDPQDKKKIQRGDSLRLKTVREERKETLFSSVLDNRVGMVQLLMHGFTNNWQAIKQGKLCYCFTTEEEIRNKGAIKLFSSLENKPGMVCVVDIFPHGLIDDLPMDKSAILHHSADYHIDSETQRFVSNFDHYPIVDSVFAVTRSEAMQIGNITQGKTLSYYTPVYNYHHGTYMMNKHIFSHCTQQLHQIIDQLVA